MINVPNVTRAAFLDKHGYWAKRECDVVTVRLWYGASSEEGGDVDLTFDEFKTLTPEQRERILDSDFSVVVET